MRFLRVIGSETFPDFFAWLIVGIVSQWVSKLDQPRFSSWVLFCGSFVRLGHDVTPMFRGVAILHTLSILSIILEHHGTSMFFSTSWCLMQIGSNGKIHQRDAHVPVESKKAEAAQN
jgi:hypothetical protein